MSSILGAGPFISQPSAPLKIRTAGYDVLACGSVITANSENLEFQLAHLGVVFAFMSDEGQTRIQSGIASGSTLTLSLYNFNNSIGSGTVAPVEIGTINGRKLSLSFMVYALSPTSTKTVHYTFLLGDKS